MGNWAYITLMNPNILLECGRAALDIIHGHPSSLLSIDGSNMPLRIHLLSVGHHRPAHIQTVSTDSPSI